MLCTQSDAQSDPATEGRTVQTGDAELAADRRFRARVGRDGLVQVAVPPPGNSPEEDDEAGPYLVRVGGLVHALLAAERARVQALERAYELEEELERLRAVMGQLAEEVERLQEDAVGA